MNVLYCKENWQKSRVTLKRKTFIYDLYKYDCVIVITDASKAKTQGLDTLLAALSVSGNKEIYVVQWL